MNTVHEESYVNCPVSQAHLHLDAFFGEHTQKTQDPTAPVTMQLGLRVPLAIPGLKTNLSMRRDVSATLERVRATSNVVDMLLVRWEALGGGPYPRFQGQIEVKGAEDYDSFRLVLSGTYEPPFGMLGEAFDSVVGRWIAIATARDLLERMREAIEASYRSLEAAKAARVEERSG